MDVEMIGLGYYHHASRPVISFLRFDYIIYDQLTKVKKFKIEFNLMVNLKFGVTN